MQEIQARLIRYRDVDLEKELSSAESLAEFSERFFADVAEIYGSITRIRNAGRNPSGFSSQDSPILGLLVRISKVLKELAGYYGKSNGDMIGVLGRPVMEGAVLATHFLRGGDSAVEEYRKRSDEDRVKILKEAAAHGSFFNTPARRRMGDFVRSRMPQDGDDHLTRNADGTFCVRPEDPEVDPRVVAAILRLCDEPYRLWLKRIDAESTYLTHTLNWIRTTNTRLFEKAEAAEGS
jgi:hypothetical protein